MWDVINLNKNGELITVEMIFIDEKGNLMHGTIRRNQVQRFKDKLIEGSLFTIKNFKVVEAIGRCKPVENSLALIFIASTVISNLSEDIVHIPINGFQFIKPTMIDSRVNNDEVLSDVVGCLYGIGGMEIPRSTWKRRDN
ncbi:hypothetical protein HAX54_011958 [Datura stramonium]|uniref:Replication protein A 70 kDa DNA-binding subunit B/D first OB fold domain-containing protein n=1 Tax=Datura stramonium TaxID=4076 RepID=A0ABS8RX99_DATST|nr:hypothetical protein [Datura stramonium]